MPGISREAQPSRLPPTHQRKLKLTNHAHGHAFMYLLFVQLQVPDEGFTLYLLAKGMCDGFVGALLQLIHSRSVQFLPDHHVFHWWLQAALPSRFPFVIPLLAGFQS